MFTDFVLNGEAHGEIAEAMTRFDVGMLRPYIDDAGRKCVTINTGRKKRDEKTGLLVPDRRKFEIKYLRERYGMDCPVWNAVSLRKDVWIEMDRAVIMAARQRLSAWSDLMSASRAGGFDAMAKLTYEYEAMSDPGEAIVDMDGLAEGRTDNPLFKLRSIPLPITHSDFFFSKRRMAVSANSSTPLSPVMAEAAGRRVAEMIEKTLIGVETGATFGPNSTTDTRYENSASTVYGYTNFPQRITKTDLTTPTGSNPEAVKQDVIEMREQLYSAGFYGPFMLYHTPAYDAFLDDDYFRTGSTSISRTLRERIKEIGGIQDVRRLDFWTGSTYQMVMVQMTSNVVRAIDGMPLTTFQWESKGGWMQNWKVAAIQVPLIQADYNGTTGIVHATTS